MEQHFLNSLAFAIVFLPTKQAGAAVFMLFGTCDISSNSDLAPTKPETNYFYPTVEIFI